ncbi:MAG: imidazole glycerol phosphate synthase subunit HisF [Desulfurivibrio sp.]|nr:imidazole glycerol phosphate synthase subunit HisF [Desulfurivibrio sp.]
MITLLDYGAGNVRSVRNAVLKLGGEIREVREPADILQADKLIFPGVGNFGSAMASLQERGWLAPLTEYLRAGRPYLGICLGLQTLFEASAEAPGVAGLGLIKGVIQRFGAPEGVATGDFPLAIPQIGWNGLAPRLDSPLLADCQQEKFYFVHSYRAAASSENRDWVLAETTYGEDFISAVQMGAVAACQFHPEKSGPAGLTLLANFLRAEKLAVTERPAPPDRAPSAAADPSRRGATRPAKRIIACLDVRNNDQGDLVVTKGDQYDVREAADGVVRNLGKPVELAERYYHEGADEITFLNITAFRAFPLEDQPMLEVLERASERVFVPLTIGGGIREFTDAHGRFYSALEVAARYFRAGADKISIGSDAVTVVEAYLARGRQKDGRSSLEQIAERYGSQAVVISIDPRRVYVRSPAEAPRHHVIPTAFPGPAGEEYCWYQCTVKGGREGCDLDAATLALACQELGAGEILLNCIDKDGTNSGFDLELIQLVKGAVTIPVIASSGAGKPEHFSEVFIATGADAALAAGIFHRHEVEISEVKQHLKRHGIETRD